MHTHQTLTDTELLDALEKAGPLVLHHCGNWAWREADARAQWAYAHSVRELLGMIANARPTPPVARWVPTREEEERMRE